MRHCTGWTSRWGDPKSVENHNLSLWTSRWYTTPREGIELATEHLCLIFVDLKQVSDTENADCIERTRKRKMILEIPDRLAQSISTPPPTPISLKNLHYAFIPRPASTHPQPRLLQPILQ